jgi:hypothetical protein
MIATILVAMLQHSPDIGVHIIAANLAPKGIHKLIVVVNYGLARGNIPTMYGFPPHALDLDGPLFLHEKQDSVSMDHTMAPHGQALVPGRTENRRLRAFMLFFG